MDFVEAAKIAARSALLEDIGPNILTGDITSESVIGDEFGEAIIVAKEPGVIAGLPVLEVIFAELSAEVEWQPVFEDGAQVQVGQVVARIKGGLKVILKGERCALNFLSHLTGIATLTKQFVEETQGRAKVFDTRKTTPGLRTLEKYAVRVGGGHNHRIGLFDAILIKDNHLFERDLATSIEAAKAARAGLVEVEVETIEQLKVAIASEADIVLLDNMGIEEIKAAVLLAKGQVEVEVSGGIKLGNVSEIAEAGPDRISVGALTQSAPAVDFSMTIVSRERT